MDQTLVELWVPLRRQDSLPLPLDHGNRSMFIPTRSLAWSGAIGTYGALSHARA